MRSRGHTFIEVLVVLAIMAIVAGAAVLAVGASGGARAAEREAQRLAELTRLMCERAQFTGHEFGLSITPVGYSFSRSGYRRWEPVTADELRPRALPSGFALSGTREGHALSNSPDDPEEPQVVCFPSGELTPFELEIAASADAVSQVVGALDGSTEVRMAGSGTP